MGNKEAPAAGTEEAAEAKMEGLGWAESKGIKAGGSGKLAWGACREWGKAI